MDSKKSAPKNNATFLLDEQTYHFLFEQHSAIMLLLEAGTGNILEANQAAVKFYGYPRSKLCSMSIQEIIIFSPEPGIGEFQNAIDQNPDHLVFTHGLVDGCKRIVEVYSPSILQRTKRLFFRPFKKLLSAGKLKQPCVKAMCVSAIWQKPAPILHRQFDANLINRNTIVPKQGYHETWR